MTVDAAPARAQLIKIETDRRLGHEWDEWDGRPLDNGGDFSAPARLYFGFTAVGLVLVAALSAPILFLLAPRLALLAGWLPAALNWAVALATGASLLWLVLIAVSVY